MSDCDCKTKDDFQPFPASGILADQMNCDLDALQKKIGPGDEIIYFYVIATVQLKDGCFIQTGSGPNFQGERITLCTCKHRMRTFLSKEQWIGKWVAGFTGIHAGNNDNALVYLMKISQAYASHAELWDAEEVSLATKRAKAADRSKFGDLFQPGDKPGSPFDYKSYLPPVNDHVHAPDNKWHKDIDYKSRSGQRASLLVGDPANSFLWDQPKYYLAGPNLHRGQRKSSIQMLLDALKATPCR